MSAEETATVWLGCGYAVFLLAVAYGLDATARRVAGRTQAWRTGGFSYHADHDAWRCPQDQWLWPHSFDPDNRVMRYRASPLVCNACPVKSTCTTSAQSREVSRGIDPWPSSEAERFHRGIACAVAVVATLWPLATAFAADTATESLVLVAAAAAVALGSWPLWSHLRRTPAGFPDHVPVQTLDDAAASHAAAEAAAQAKERRRRTAYRSDIDRRDIDRGDIDRGDINRSDSNRDDSNRDDINRGDINRGDINRGDTRTDGRAAGWSRLGKR